MVPSLPTDAGCNGCAWARVGCLGRGFVQDTVGTAAQGCNCLISNAVCLALGCQTAPHQHNFIWDCGEDVLASNGKAVIHSTCAV